MSFNDSTILPRALFAAIALTTLVAAPAFAQTPPAANCMQDIYNAAGLTQALNCNSKDVKIANVTGITPISGLTPNGNGTYLCDQGSTIEFTADFQVVLGANARYDIGLYIGEGQSNALHGTCNTAVITSAPQSNSTTFRNLDGDACGDISGKLGTDFNPQIVHMDVTALCATGALANGKLTLPNCTSWREPGSNEVCNTINDAYPGSPSKCNCDSLTVTAIGVEPLQLGVTKSASPTMISAGLLSGTDVTFTVTVTNPLATTSITLSSLTEDDNNDGVVDKLYNSASTPSLADRCGGTTTLAPGATMTCSFVRKVALASKETITDRACVSGVDGNGRSVGPQCATATVSATDVSATLSKTAQGLQCATVRYQVDVQNTDPNEALTLSALSDDTALGQTNDITTLHDNVLGTTCGVAQGSGSLASQAGAGALPASIASGAHYICQFDLYMCGLGQVTDTVTATLGNSAGTQISPSGKATVTVQNVTTP